MGHEKDFQNKKIGKMDRSWPNEGSQWVFKFSEVPPIFIIKKLKFPCGFCKKYADSLMLFTFFAVITNQSWIIITQWLNCVACC
jgi:hypothetical protein